MQLGALLIKRWALGRSYPHANPPTVSPHQTQDLETLERFGLVHADLESALKTLNTFVDVQEDELLDTAHFHTVFNRPPKTPLSELIRQVSHKGLPHVPIITAQRKVVGMVTQSDLRVALYKNIALQQAGRQDPT